MYKYLESKMSWKKFGLFFVLAVFFSGVHANVVIYATRLIFNATDTDIPIRLNNAGDTPALVQVWADTGKTNSTPDTADAPFLMIPPIFRMDPAKNQTVRMSFTGADLPLDRESVFWLNVLEIPPKPKGEEAEANLVQIAFRYRIKIFYRPKDLKGDAEKAADQLAWSVKKSPDGKQYAVHAENPGNFHVSIAPGTIEIDGKKYETLSGMVPPRESYDFLIQEMIEQPKSPFKYNYEFINDYGAGVVRSVTVNP